MTWVNAIVQGILIGGLYALFATGLSLGFGVMRLVNLAHGDLAVLAAYVALSLSTTLTINPLTTLVIVLPGAFVVGVVLQRLVFDRVVGVDPAFAIVATFGLSIVIQNALLEKYTADTQGLYVGELETSSITINDQISIGWLPLITFLLRRRRARLRWRCSSSGRSMGRAFRATSDDPEAARLMGIDNRRVYGVALGIAVLTVALAGVLMGAQSSFDPFIGPEPTDLRVRGGDHRWPRLVVGHARRWDHTRRRPGPRARVQLPMGRADGPRRVPRRARHPPDGHVRQGPGVTVRWRADARTFVVRRSTTASRIFGIVALVAIVVLALLPTFAEASTEFKMVELLTLIALAQMWNLLAGFAGVVSVGQQAFVGLGAYGMIVFVNNQGFNLYLSVGISAVAAMLVSIPMGLIAFRLRGSYFAIGTWVLAEVCSLLMINNTSVGGGSGASIKVTDYDLATRQDVTYWFALVAGVGAIVAELPRPAFATRSADAGHPRQRGGSAGPRRRTCTAPGSRSG